MCSSDLNKRDEDSFKETSVWVSGPILKDKVFFYALFNPRKEEFEGAENTTFFSAERKSDRWLANLEWFVTDKHSLRATAFNTKRETEINNFAYDDTTNTVGAFTGLTTLEDGGKFWGASYHGELTHRLALDIVYGKTQEEEVPRPQNFRPLVEDCRTGSCFAYSTHSDSSINPQEFARKQFHANFSLDLDDHAIKLGIDSYDIDVDVDE